MADHVNMIRDFTQAVKALLDYYKIELLATEIKDALGHIQGVEVAFRRDEGISEKLKFITNIPAEPIGCILFVACVQDIFDKEEDDGSLLVPVPPVSILYFAPEYASLFKSFRRSVRQLLSDLEVSYFYKEIICIEGYLLYKTLTPDEGPEKPPTEDKDILDKPIKPYLLN